MKLLLVTPYFYPKIGGLENYAFTMVKELKRKYKWEIVVITSNHISRQYKEEKMQGLKIYRLPILFKISNTPINPFWYWQIKRIMLKENPDIINAHTPVPFIADMAAIAAGSIPLILTYHAFSLYKYRSSVINLLIRGYKSLEYFLFKKADKIIVVSEAVKTIIPSEFKHKTYVVYNAISSKELSNGLIKKKNNIPSVVFMSSLDRSHDWKGLKEILLAFKIILKLNKIHLFIIGDGNNRQHYEKLTKKYGIVENVVFLGKKDGVTKNKILQNSTAAIIYPNSSNDAFPTVALEYWANKLPIIAANIIPINSLFKHNKTAYLVKPNNPKALANAIKNLLKKHILMNKIANTGYKELKEKYILENEVRKFYFLSKELII